MKVTKKRQKEKGRKESGPFTAIPHAVQDCPNWKLCSGTSIKLLCELARQFNGRNNGDLCAAMSVLRNKGWRSPDTLSRSLKELLHFGFITLTRQGGLNRANLYALTWKPIDECEGKLDCGPTAVASGDWKVAKTRFKPQGKNASPNTESVAARYGIRSSRSQLAA
jgi:hypothetical protein